MSVRVEIVSGPLAAAAPKAPADAGAILQFEGVVRPTEDDRRAGPAMRDRKSDSIGGSP
jgi:hypothetical protein